MPAWAKEQILNSAVPIRRPEIYNSDAIEQFQYNALDHDAQRILERGQSEQ
jgi:hypothetical protein